MSENTIKPVRGKAKRMTRKQVEPAIIWLVPYGDTGSILVIDATTHCALRLERPVMLELPTDDVLSLDPLHG